MSPETIQVEICYALRDRQWLLRLSVPVGATLEQAIALSALSEQIPELIVDPKRVGIFSKIKPMSTILQQGDRVEIYRPLLADPKESRRRRAQGEA